jgi:hypothetical protein
VDEEQERPSRDIVRDWRLSELRRLGFTLRQRAHLISLMETDPYMLAEVRRKVEERGWLPELVFLDYAPSDPAPQSQVASWRRRVAPGS